MSYQIVKQSLVHRVFDAIARPRHSPQHGLASTVKRMVVADENAHAGGPAKKRPRLSLKERKNNAAPDENLSQEDLGTQGSVYQGLTPLDINQPICQDEGGGEMMTEVNNDLDCSLLSGGCQSELPRIPPVASLENIGNTCYLNSILEILRYTPVFLAGLEQLYKSIVDVETKMKELRLENEEMEDLKPCLELPKQLYLLYKRMERMEERYAEVASSDVSSMAVKPDKVLNVIRKINAMFEGFLQHDAQELLHCLLGSLREGEDELHKVQVLLLDKEIALSLQDTLKEPDPPTTSPKRSPRFNKQASPVKTTAKMQVWRQIFGPCKPVQFQGSKHITDKACAKSSVEECFTPPSIVNGVGKLNLESKSAVTSREKWSPPPASRMTQSENCQINLNKGRTARRGRKPACLGPKRQLALEFEKSALTVKRQRADRTPADGMAQKTITSMFPRVSVQSSRSLGIRRQLVLEDPSGESMPTESGSALQTAHYSMAMNGDAGSDHGESSSSEESRMEDLATKDCELSSSSGLTAPHKSRWTLSPNSKKSSSPTRKIPQPSPKTDEDLSESESTPSTVQFTSISSPSKRRAGQSVSVQEISGISSPSVGISGLANFTQASRSSNRLQPTLKLEKCDFVYHSSSQSVNFKEAMRHLSPKKGLSERRGGAGGWSSSSSYGATSTFTSVPMKKAMIKVEKCDSVCGSPAKSVNAKYAERCLSGTTVPKREFVKQLFLGNMYLRTRCLECETCRDRVEEFQDISVPLHNEQQKKRTQKTGIELDKRPCIMSTENENSCLSKLMSAFSAVELLSGDNKYNCSVCKQMSEAERSIHYKSIPDILILHLKRFSANAGCYASLSKINDHVDIPLTLPCLRQCVKPCPNPEHRYVLFGVVTHAGSTISNGHYLSYVKVCPNSSVKGSEVHTRIADFLSSDSQPAEEGSEPQYQWLACDDETIRIHSEEEFHTMLSGKGGNLVGNPYVLFYHRMNNQLGTA